MKRYMFQVISIAAFWGVFPIAVGVGVGIPLAMYLGQWIATTIEWAVVK